MRVTCFRPVCIALLLVLSVIWVPAYAQVQQTRQSSSKVLEAMKAGDFKTALSQIERALAENPDDLELEYGLGMIYLRLGRVDEAETIFEALVCQDEQKFRRAYFDLALIASDRGNETEALALLQKARPVDPAKADYESGMVYLKTKEFARAAESFRQVRAAKSELTVDSMINEAVALGYLEKFDEAEKLVESVLSMKTTGSQKALAEELLAGLKAAEPGARRWHLSGLIGFQYDSNVVQSSEQVAAVSEQSGNKDDFAQTSVVSGRYDLFRKGPWVMGTGYNHYNLTYFNHADLSVVGARPSLYGSWNSGPYQAGLEYVFSHYVAGGQSQVDVHALYPSFVLSGGEKWRTEVRGWAEWRSFFTDSPDERYYGFGVTEFYLMRQGLWHIRTGVNIDFDDTTPSDAGSFQDTKFTAGIQIPVWKDKWFLDLSGFYILRDFRFTPAISTDTSRKDKEKDLYVTLHGPVVEHVRLLFTSSRSGTTPIYTGPPTTAFRSILLTSTGQ